MKNIKSRNEAYNLYTAYLMKTDDEKHKVLFIPEEGDCVEYNADRVNSFRKLHPDSIVTVEEYFIVSPEKNGNVVEYIENNLDVLNPYIDYIYEGRFLPYNVEKSIESAFSIKEDSCPLNYFFNSEISDLAVDNLVSDYQYLLRTNPRIKDFYSRESNKKALRFRLDIHKRDVNYIHSR